MGSVQRNPNGDCIEDTSVEQLLSTDSPNMYNVFGEPELHPRVGEEYQVEIPPLISNSDYHLYKKSPFELKSKSVTRTDFVIGLPIPIMHINKELDLKDGLLLCRSAKERKAYKKHISKGYCLLPGSFGGLWSEIEEGCFLLGLYIFGKDFVSMKKFVEGKTMGDIQLYYYGRFYKSNEYRRWSDSRKVRTRKCVYGHKLFSGMRQQELLSRLFPRVSEDFQNNLSQASKNYDDGRLSLNEYVFALKAIVGVEIFVEAVAIGKGKRDLTSITMEPPKPNQTAPPRNEMPSGKAYSSLSPQEITKVLTGGFRLSKAKSNDLFWEAVWPRLLARGWHSEQPKDQIYAFGTRGNLVFLIPGVKKFSRRKLVKGNHYFDCVMDVLNKVALDPSLIKLDNEEGDNIGNKAEDRWTKETTPELDDMSNQRRHRYLQPRTPKREKGAFAGVMKFTIVDTSMTDGKVFRIRELKTFIDDEALNMTIVSETNSESSDENGSENSFQNSDIEDIKASPPIRVLFEEKDIETIVESNDPDFEYKIAKRVREDNDFGERPKKSPKCYRGSKKGDHIYLSPLVKKSRKLSSCTQSTKSGDQVINPTVATDSSENTQVDSFSKEGSFDGTQGFAHEANDCLEGLSNSPKSRELIDLNLPQVSSEFENGEVLTMESKDENCDQMSKVENFTAPENKTQVISSDHQPTNNNIRRHSTRNRPPTMKVLEAVAHGYLSVNTRKKKKQVRPANTSSIEPGNRASVMEGKEDLGNNGSEDTQMTDVENGESNAESGTFGKSHVFPGGKAYNEWC